uniref:Ribonuclease H-like domain-containing protein n=1 Tax=Tanacetum cinerariifolium TaxID=118510 RepID=A0A6L2MF16_TANCI|nr:ribonuclease H-like domain-containing protein [Tanacetum cinerariifolium]
MSATLSDGYLSSPVVKPDTIRTILSLAVSRDWPIHQLDMKSAFLHGHLSDMVYMHQLHGFVDSTHPDYVCHLQCSLYGLKQALRAWFQRFATRIGFQHIKTDTSLFIFHRGSDIAYLLLYVADIILTASFSIILQRIIDMLHSEFAMTDLGSLNYFLGISTQRIASGMFLSQSKFAEEILERARMQNCNSCWTHVDIKSKLGPDGDPITDSTLYRSLVGALQYLTFTRPDLSYDVQQVCLYMHDPREPHFNALKRILRYVCSTIDYGLQLHVSSTAQLTAYIDVDWAGCPVTRRSTSGYCVFCDNFLSWSAKRQVTLSRSSVEAEYRGVANVVAETAHVRETITITSAQNTDGIIQVEEVEEVEKKPVRIIPGPTGDIKTFLKNEKLEQVVAIIKSCSPNALGDLKVTVKDLSGSAIILANVSLFSPNPSMHYLNITKKNMVKVFHKDFEPGNGSGVGGSEMLMEKEEILKLMEEEEMADLELHVCGNVIDQEDLYKFDEEALDLVLEEEEASESRAHEEWLEKCRQQEEKDAEHECWIPL